MNPFKTYRGFPDVLAREWAILAGRPKLWVACLAIMGIPALYASTYLLGVWDPYGSLNQLPVGLVNRDAGAQAQARPVNLGQHVVSELEARKPFRLHTYATADEARKAVEAGDDYFALVIPEDFSRRAIAAQSGQPARVTLLASEGASFMASLVGKRFASQVAENVNEALNEERWHVVLGQLQPLRTGVGQLRAGAHRLEAGSGQLAAGAGRLSAGLAQAHDGSNRLAAGAGQVAEGVGRVTAGMGQVGSAVHLMATRLPPDATLDRLAAGSRQVADGNRQLAAGLDQLSAGGKTLAEKNAELAEGLGRLDEGSGKLAEGAGQLREGSARVPLVGAMLAAGAGRVEAGASLVHEGAARAHQGGVQLAAGATRLSEGVAKADAGSHRLAAGAVQVDQGVQALSAGVKRLGGGLRRMDARLPAKHDLARLSDGATLLAEKNGELSRGLARLDHGGKQLAAGAGKLHDGGHRLAAGLNLLYEKLPGKAAGDPKALATSVEAVTEQVAPVKNNGVAFAPYFMALALWMGAVMTAFVFHFTVLPESVRDSGQRARMLAKGVLPSGIVIGQAIVLGLVMQLGLHIPVPHPAAFYFITLAAALTYLNIVMALIMILGDAGKLVAVVLLVFQLAAAGGPFPIELAPHFYQQVHPFLPIAHIVKALRATLFGAYDGQWARFALEMVSVGVLAQVVALAIGRRRWKYVPDENYGPILDL